ncbi:hypothetical protein Godav_029022 [Gossypium davidsonii]|uniref:Uncharacterized protein n=1 Tax=Gossypium davidsonii TaxID=34287 RepID=A0A7J8TCD4_GOSDV|nr:hypothetical protein [Gossypium davidsonii]
MIQKLKIIYLIFWNKSEVRGILGTHQEFH